MAKVTEPPKLSHLAPKWFHQWVEDNRQWMIENRIIQGLNTQVSDAPGGGKRVDALTGKVQQTIWHPFQVYPAADITKLTVYPESTIITSDNWNGFQAITNLTTPFVPNENDKVYLELTFDTAGELTAAELKHSAAGWTEWPVFFTGGGRNEDEDEWFTQKWYHLIGYLTNAESWEPAMAFFSGGVRQKFVQCTTTNLMVFIMCSNDEDKKLIHALMPWSGAFTD